MVNPKSASLTNARKSSERTVHERGIPGRSKENRIKKKKTNEENCSTAPHSMTAMCKIKETTKKKQNPP